MTLHTFYLNFLYLAEITNKGTNRSYVNLVSENDTIFYRHIHKIVINVYEFQANTATALLKKKGKNLKFCLSFKFQPKYVELL